MENTNSTPINAMLDSIVKLLVEHLTEEVIKNLPYFTDADRQMAALDARLTRTENLVEGQITRDELEPMRVQLNAQSTVIERFDTRIDKVETITAQAMSKADVEAYCADEDFVKRADVEDIVTDQLPDFDDLVGERLPDMDDYLQTSDLESELENVHVPVADSDVQTAVENVIGDLLAKLRITRI